MRERRADGGQSECDKIRAAMKQMKSGKAGRSNDVPCLILEEFLIRLFNKGWLRKGTVFPKQE